MRSPATLTLPLMVQSDPGSIAFSPPSDTPPDVAPTPTALASMRPVNSAGTDGPRDLVGRW